MGMVCATAEAFEYSECAVLTRWGAYNFAPPIWKNLNKALPDNGTARAQKFYQCQPTSPCEILIFHHEITYHGGS